MSARPAPALPGYELQGVIGRGGMGVVYRAIQVDLERPVAVKTISRELMGEERFRKRFVRESRTAASLDHPHIVPILAAGEHDGLLFIVMRLIEGQSLADLLRREGRLEPREAIAIVTQAASALSAAHRAGIVHRDVKPGNILLAGEAPYHVFLTDFGLAVSESSNTSLTATGEWIGTLEYAAPEQLRGDAVDARADTYALACVLFACLTGHPPSTAETSPDVPVALDRVLRRALAKRREDRFATVDAFAAALEAALDAPAEKPTRVMTARRPKAGGRRRAAVLGAGAATLAAAALAVVALSGDDNQGGGARRPARTAPRPPAGPRPALASAGTVRCAAGTCRQGATRVIAPAEGAACSLAGIPGTWARIDDDTTDPILVCRPPDDQPAPVVTRVPDLVGARLSRAHETLDRLGVPSQASSDSLLGILDEANWIVCDSSPAPGAALATDLEVTLFVERRC